MNNLVNDKKIRQLTLCGMMTAVITVSTMIIRIPIPATGGYVHPGDAFIILAALLLNPLSAIFAAGFGSALADLLGGYLVYAPATLVIKAASALCALLVFRIIAQLHAVGELAAAVIAGLAAEAMMVFGYFLFESILYGTQTAAVGVIPNISQGIFGILLSIILFGNIKRIAVH